MQMLSKQHGIEGHGADSSELDLNFLLRPVSSAPDAYERLFLDVIRGDHSSLAEKKPSNPGCGDQLISAWESRRLKCTRRVPRPGSGGVVDWPRRAKLE